MQNTDFKNLFSTTDSILICDTSGKVLYYEDFNDNISSLKNVPNIIGRTIFELYPFIKEDEFTVIKSIKLKKPIFNEYQTYIIDGVQRQSINSAYPLLNENGVIGAISLTNEIDTLSDNTASSKKSPINFISTAKYDFQHILTNNDVFLKKLSDLKRFAKGESSILIYGETGTGKELIAHTLHNNSKRKSKPFVVQNCAAIPENLAESLFFGAMKGAYTGAIDKAGLFEVANGGTIFLDEVNSLPYNLQGKLLRTLETGTITKIGSSHEKNVDVRIITSTNEDLSIKVDNGEFRKDLYYRLNIINFTIPPLRERLDDISLLAEYFLNNYKLMLNKHIEGISDELMSFFYSYSWPGNIREFKNTMEYIVNYAENPVLTPSMLPDYLINPTKNEHAKEEFTYSHSPLNILKQGVKTTPIPKASYSTTLQEQIESLEKEVISSALIDFKYNISKIATTLGISRKTLYSKLEKYNLM